MLFIIGISASACNITFETMHSENENCHLSSLTLELDSTDLQNNFGCWINLYAIVVKLFCRYFLVLFLFLFLKEKTLAGIVQPENLEVDNENSNVQLDVAGDLGEKNVRPEVLLMV